MTTAIRRVALVLSLAVAAATIAWAADVLTQLGIPAELAKEEAVSAVGNGHFNTSLGAKVIKAAPPAVRAELVTGAIAWAKAYVASPEFRTAYAALRAQRKPQGPPVFKGTPQEEFTEQQAQRKAEQEKSQAEVKATLASMPPETRKAMEEAMKAAADMQARMDTPEMRKRMIDGITMQRAFKTQDYERDLKKWADDYPENPRALVVKRLQRFLDETRDVDFGAELQTKAGPKGSSVKTFVKPEYENKSGEWKQAFRAGKEALTASRTAVQAWLVELQKTT